MQQPNFGETIIFAAIWVVLLTLSGVSMRILAILGMAAIAGVILAYFFYPVATERIDAFLFASEVTDTSHTDSALMTLTAGGMFVLGHGPGSHQFRLPSPPPHHTYLVIVQALGTTP